MFRATMCTSSGETTVFMQHLVLVILYGWLSGMQEHMLLCGWLSGIQEHMLLCGWLSGIQEHMLLCGWLSGTQEHMLLYTRQSSIQEHMLLRTRQSSIQNNKYKVSHKYRCFSWWWARSHQKHVEKRNKHTKKNYAPSWIYLQDYTGMHSQQNIKNTTIL